MTKKANTKSYPKDSNQLAKFIVDIATGEETGKAILPDSKPIKKKNPKK